MSFELWSLYKTMLRSRLFEEAVIEIWNDGKISGEMHLGLGEEAIVAGVVAQLIDGDALALDHRGTPPVLMRGVDPLLLLREFLGQPDGLCAGRGGHMHLFSREHLIASSGIVGASGPAAVGFALAARHLRPKNLAVAFFGEGAMNQGMLMESLNLAVAWNLPVIFVCKDSQWAITTRSESVTGGSLLERARSFGMPAAEVDGSDVETVWKAAEVSSVRARRGKGPSFLYGQCFHPEGHFLGDPLLRVARHPLREMKEIGGPLLKSVMKGDGASVTKRSGRLGTVTALIGKTAKEQWVKQKDPLIETRSKLQKTDKKRLQKLETEIAKEIKTTVEAALAFSVEERERS